MSTPTVIQACAALYGVVPGASFVSTINTELSSVFAGDEDALLNHYYELVFVVNNGDTSEEVAARIVANLGLTGEEATSETARMAAELEATPVNERGAKVKDLIDAFEASGSEAATNFVALKTALETAVADPNYQGIQGKNVVFASLNALQIAEATEESINEVVLSLGDQAWAGTSGRDYFVGTSSGLSSTRTLDSRADIDGGEGVDTLSLTMAGDHEFTTGSGSMTNVEKVVLSNSSVIAREFSAKEITGVESYSIDATQGRISLANLASPGISISVSNHVTGDLSIGFAAAGVTGSSDSLDLTVANVGTGTATSAVLIDGIETLNITSNGSTATNELDLSNANNDVTKVTVSGDAKGLELTVGSTVDTIDGGAATGTLKIAALNAGAKVVIGSQGVNTITSTDTGATLVSLIGGAGNDTFSLNTLTGSAVATITGGEGADKLSLAGGANPVRYTVDSIETISFANTGAFTYDGSLTTGLTKVVVEDGATADLTLSNLASEDLLLDLEGANASSSVKVTAANTGTVTITATKLSTATSAATNQYGVTASKASNVSVTVGDGIVLDGTITATVATEAAISIPAATISSTGLGTNFKLVAPKAEQVSLTNAGATAGELEAILATQVTLTSSSTSAGSINVDADVLEVLDLTTAGAFEVSTASDIDTVQVVNLSSTKGLQTVPTLAKVATFTATGTGASSTLADQSGLDMDNIGSTSLDYPVTLNFSGFKGGVGKTFGTGTELTTPATGATVESKAGVSIDISDVTGQVYFGNITGGTSVNIDANGTDGKVTALTLSGDAVVVDARNTGSGSVIGSTINDANSVIYNASANDATSVTVNNKAAATSLSVEFNGSLKSDLLKVVAASTATAVTVSGNLDLQTAGDDGDLVYINATANTTSAVAVDASGVSGAEQTQIKLPDSAKTHSVKGTAGRDVIINPSTSVEKQTLTGNGGADTFIIDTAGMQLAATSNAYDTTAGSVTMQDTTKLDVITDFSFSEGDSLVFMTSGTLIDVDNVDRVALASEVGAPADGEELQLIRGALSGNKFTYSGTGADVLVLVLTTGAGVLLQGAGSGLSSSDVFTSTGGEALIIGASVDALTTGYANNFAVTGLLGVA